VKASDNSASGGSQFGWSLAMSSDGNTLAVSTLLFTMGPNAGSYVFTRTGTTWSEQTKVPGGISLFMSPDGNMLAIGQTGDNSNATGIDGDPNATTAPGAGAVVVLTRSGATWTQLHYVKASNTRQGAGFGWAVAISSDKKTLAVGANSESSASTGINGDQSDTSTNHAGAVYVY
jgi:hypothetical protein